MPALDVIVRSMLASLRIEFAAGHALNHQVVQRKSLGCLPSGDAWKYESCMSAQNSKGVVSSCFSVGVCSVVSPLAESLE